MLFYIFLFLIISTCAFFDLVNLQNRHKLVLIISISILFVLLGGLRWQTGNDWIPYYQFFIGNYNFDDFTKYHFEIGYVLFNFMIKNITESYTIFLIFLSLFVVYFSNAVIYRYSRFPIISILLLFSSGMPEIFPIRQYMSIVVAMYSINFIVSKNRLNFFICVILASSFHLSALFFLPAYYIYYLKIKKRHYIVFVLLSLCIGYSGISHQLVENLIGLIGGEANRYMMYLNMDLGFDTGYFSFEEHSWVTMSRKLLMVPIVLYLLKYFNDFEKRIVNLVIFGYCSLILLNDISMTLSNRLSYYYNIFEIFLIPICLRASTKIIVKIICFLIIILYCFTKYVYSIVGNPPFIPYNSVFDNLLYWF